ncbi:hypothetical protein GNI_078770 [Gregarina niphandrodes]|uniref:Uncharacterized protein n=1 Tax=Gregarina niphandrodes TaxID=110365 RepID=A0A023B6J8_GRENI|nr:hypothetical protein GNI_078770 [Gregarina niphandrodes]EZG66590.1 hypothetical protein GNI_078770 [Gregarina niphandrodes]|eukprot:XP_011130576.1 hypothetical protein GNI_078770 [Gregarina niphandrodes]
MVTARGSYVCPPGAFVTRVIETTRDLRELTALRNVSAPKHTDPGFLRIAVPPVGSVPKSILVKSAPAPGRATRASVGDAETAAGKTAGTAVGAQQLVERFLQASRAAAESQLVPAVPFQSAALQSAAFQSAPYQSASYQASGPMTPGESLIAVWVSARGCLLRVDEDELRCEFGLSCFSAMGGPSPMAGVESPAVVGMVSGQRLCFEDLAQQGHAALGHGTALLSAAPSGLGEAGHEPHERTDDVALALPFVKWECRVLRCFGTAKPVPDVFRRIQIPLANDECFTLNKNLLVPTSLSTTRICIQISTNQLKEAQLLVQSVTDRISDLTKAATKRQDAPLDELQDLPSETADRSTVDRSTGELRSMGELRGTGELRSTGELRTTGELRNTAELRSTGRSNTSSGDPLTTSGTVSGLPGSAISSFLNTSPGPIGTPGLPVLSEKELLEDQEQLKRAHKINTVVYDYKYDNLQSRYSDEDRARVLQRYPVSKPKSRSALGRMLWERMASRHPASPLAHVGVFIPAIEIVVLDRGLTTLRAVVAGAQMQGPVPLIGESEASVEATLHVLASNLTANKEESLLSDPISVNITASRTFLTGRYLPVVDIQVRVSKTVATLEAGTAQNLYRLAHSFSTLSTPHKPDETHATVINATGNRLGVTVQLPKEGSKKGPPLWSDQGALDKLVAVSEILANEHVCEKTSHEIFFSIRKAFEPMLVLTYGSATGLNVREQMLEQRGLSTRSRRVRRVAEEEGVAGNGPAVDGPVGDGATGDGAAGEVSIPVTLGAGEAKPPAQSFLINTPEQLVAMWNDLSLLGDSDFLTVSRILLEDDELRERVKAVAEDGGLCLSDTKLYRLVSSHEEPGAAGRLQHSSLDDGRFDGALTSIRGLVEARKPYRVQLARAQGDLLLSTSRHVECLIEDIVKDAPFLLRSRLAQLSSANLHSQIFKQSDGWTACGLLQVNKEGAKAYHVDGVGYRLMVEPQLQADGSSALFVGSTVLVENSTPFKLVLNCTSRVNRFKHLAHKLLSVRLDGLPRPMTKALMILRDRLVYTTQHETSFAQEADRLVVLPFKKNAIPISWFQDPRGKQFSLVLCHPDDQSERGGALCTPKNLDNLQDLLSVMETAESVSQLDKTGNSIALVIRGRLGKLLQVVQSLVVGKQLALTASVRSFHVPTARQPEMVQGFVLHIEPFMKIKNNLTYPVTVTLASPTKNRPQPDEEEFGTGRSQEEVLTGRTLISHATSDEIERLFSGRPVTASIPSGWIWCLPLAMQTLDLTIAVHGLPLQRARTHVTQAYYKAAKGLMLTGRYHDQVVALALKSLKKDYAMKHNFWQTLLTDGQFSDRDGTSSLTSAGVGSRLIATGQLPPSGTINRLYDSVAVSLLAEHDIHCAAGQTTPPDLAELPEYQMPRRQVWLQGDEGIVQAVDSQLKNPQAMGLDPELSEVCTLTCKSVMQSIYNHYPLEICTARRSIDIMQASVVENTLMDTYLIINEKPVPPLSSLNFSTEELGLCHISLLRRFGNTWKKSLPLAKINLTAQKSQDPIKFPFPL